jgi:hypothetical protein
MGGEGSREAAFVRGVTSRQLTALCRKWQARLGLLDWTISTKLVPADKLDKDCVANCWWRSDEMVADVWIDESAGAKESSLVHELLHILYQGHGPVQPYNVNLERAINKTTSALCEPRRKRKA